MPFLARPVCLPVLARLWRPRHTGKIAFARQMVEAVAARYPDRVVHAVGDAAYVGEHLRGLSRQITWTSRLKVTSVLHELAPPRTGQSGRPRTKGARLGTPADLAATAIWRTTEVRRYGRCACRKPRPYRSSGMPVFVEDAAESIASSDVEVVESVRFGDWLGERA
ncbi:MAG TPA: hypothetical protein VGP31_06165 [Planosporangium sp.]|nr:hypothetical protein [Planosporangium sp.]